MTKTVLAVSMFTIFIVTIYIEKIKTQKNE